MKKKGDAKQVTKAGKRQQRGKERNNEINSERKNRVLMKIVSKRKKRRKNRKRSGSKIANERVKSKKSKAVKAHTNQIN